MDGVAPPPPPPTHPPTPQSVSVLMWVGKLVVMAQIYHKVFHFFVMLFIGKFQENWEDFSEESDMDVQDDSDSKG